MLHERVHTGGDDNCFLFYLSFQFTYLSERPYKCKLCQKSFAFKANYLSHMKTHEQRAYDCKSCGLHHVSAAKLRLHEDTEHPDERPFKCPNCRKTFKASHSLDLHKHKCVGFEIELKARKSFKFE